MTENVKAKIDAVVEEFSNIGIVPVIKLDKVENAEKLAKALRDGGINCAEVTFRAKGADEVIARMVKAYPDMMVGAGTVLTCEQADAAYAAGAKFCVAPGLNPKVVSHCLEKGIPFAPGLSSASEIEQALELGLDFVKFFPADQHIHGARPDHSRTLHNGGGILSRTYAGIQRYNLMFVTSPERLQQIALKRALSFFSFQVCICHADREQLHLLRIMIDLNALPDNNDKDYRDEQPDLVICPEVSCFLPRTHPAEFCAFRLPFLLWRHVRFMLFHPYFSFLFTCISELPFLSVYYRIWEYPPVRRDTAASSQNCCTLPGKWRSARMRIPRSVFI